jgi:uncharacterized protein YfaS (alpha-2-macroglobulin family)
MNSLRQSWERAFGVLTWNPPAWVQRAARWAGTHRPLSALLLAAVATCSGGGAWLYTWYKHLPPPRTVAAWVDDIPVTHLEKILHPPTLRIEFAGSVAPLKQIGRPVATGISLDPAMDGYWKWDSDRLLSFHPSQDWPAATRYQVTLARTAVARRALLSRYQFHVRTPEFRAHIKKLEFYQDPSDATMKKVVATIEFTHAVPPGEIEKTLTLAMLGDSQVFPRGAPRFSVDLGLHNRIAYIHTPRLDLPEQEDFMKLVLAKDLQTSQGGAALKEDLSGTVKIPNKFAFFKIDGVEGTIARKPDGDPEQFIVIKTSADATPEAVAAGVEIYLLPHPKKKAPDADDADASGDDEQEDSDKSGDSDQEATPDEAAPEWQSPSEVDPDVLAAATRVPFTLMPSGTETARVHTFKISVASTGSLYVRVKKGTKAVGDFELSDDYNAVVRVPVPPVELSIEAKGGLLALSGERKISIVSRGVEAIEYTISRVPADQINHLVSQTEGEFQNPRFLNDSFDETNIARIVREKQTIAAPGRFKPSYSTFDFSSHLGPATDGGSALQGLFFLEVKAWDPKTKKYLQDVSERRFILVTDLGILVKENADESRDVFIQALAARAGMAGATVQVLSRNGVPALTGTTGTDGRVSFGAIGKVPREMQPIAIVARNGQDVAFIPYDRDDRQVDFSRFDIGGSNILTGRDLNAFVFTERGVYRPGDVMHIAYSVKQANWSGDLTGLPLETEVVDARNAKAQVKRINLPAGGFGEFTYQTAYASPTGDYGINIYLVKDGKRGDLIGSTGAEVKEFLPDRMKIEAHLSKNGAKGWITPEDVSAQVTLRNLYGTPATKRRITGKIELCPAGFYFDGFEGYTFFDRLRDQKPKVESQSDDLGEDTTDDNGSVSFDLNLERFADATYQMTFETEGFEAEGGRSVATSVSTLVSALPYVIGYKSDGSLDYVKMNRGQTVEFIAIDQGLNRIAVQNLKLSLIQQDYVSVLTRQDDGTYAYESVEKDQLIGSQPVTVPAEGWKYTLPVGNPGTYRAELRNADGDRVSVVWFTVVGEGDTRRALDRNAELKVKLDRPAYNSGDDIEVSIVAPYTGSGLITIERDKVYASQWFSTDKTSTVQHIRLPEGLDGTGYINVSFIRALDSHEVFMSPLSYGVVPFEANRDRRKINLNLQTVKVSKPGEPLKISYKADRPARIVIFAVDEGILQVTGYTTPDPLDYFFQKQALSVNTSQIVDLILPEFSILRAAATGGDGEGRQLNPFRRVTDKPVVYWSGILDVDTTEREVTYDVPDYFSGNLKVMAVAISGDAVGSAETESIIRGPFVITPGVPTFVAPGDQFEVGITVANNVAGSGTNAPVSITAEPSEQLEVIQAPVATVPISEGREEAVTFIFRATEKLGSGSITFHASTGAQESRLRSTLSVRPPVALMTDVRGGNFGKESVDLAVTRQFRPEYRNLQAVLSALPLGLAHGLDSYLQTYPNGCSEQLSSAALCRLLLSDEADFGLKRPEVAAQMDHTFEMLRHRQNDQGAFGYWGPESRPKIDFLSTYVMHFLIEARDAGFDPPVDMFQLGMRNLQRMVSETPADLEEERTVAYAIYLLTREEVITTNYILNLRDNLDRSEKDAWKADITGVYLAGAYALLQKDEEANDLIRAYRLGAHEGGDCWYDFHTPLGMDAQYIAIVSRHFPQVLNSITPRDFHRITDPIENGDFNTLSAAYAVLALKSYSHHLRMNPPQLAISELANNQWHLLNADGDLLKRAPFSGEAKALRFEAHPAVGGPGAYYQTISTGFETGTPAEIRDGLEIYREYRNADGTLARTVKMGDPVKVVIRIRSLTGRDITNVSIVDLLPGGFEVSKSSIEPGQESCGCDYVDVREDRILLYTTVTPGVLTIRYEIKPTNRGQFTAPPIFAESMYDRTIKARALGTTLKVINPE